MGIYINPGNAGFTEICGKNYVDKTGLIHLINQTIGQENKLTCISRPRRFGKSYAARMLTAYYDHSCDSHKLFDNRKIADAEDYKTHLNQYNVIYLDITGFISEARRKNESLRMVPDRIVDAIQADLLTVAPEAAADKALNDNLIRFAERPDGRKYVFIIDEWDAMIREAKDDEIAQRAYLNLLRGWFKNANFTPRAVAAAYMTGILPIKKDGSQSAISDFEEYSMIDPWEYGDYVGFTEAEVIKLCEAHGIDFAEVKRWYDGYRFPGTASVYNPNSVMKAVRRKRFDSYWTETSAAEGLLDYISKDYNGLPKTIAELIGGVEVKVNTSGFANDLTTFRGKDDVLTLMIHLGYLAYDSRQKNVRIPNEEIRQEFQRSIHEVKHEATLKRLEESEQLFADTIQMHEEAVAAQIEKVHTEETVALHYNKEDSLRSVIKLAYYSYRDHYLQFEELPAGEGYADIVYLPKADSDWPALVIELKWNKTAEGAIEQILKKKYPSVLENYGREVLLVGISYDKDAPAGEKKHCCRIQRAAL
ncbi:MAG: AAA family ATPase [Oscillospiraceae bacterium]|nr:AAA family ATPase [Oscillospiraceae bacterium]